MRGSRNIFSLYLYYKKNKGGDGWGGGGGLAIRASERGVIFEKNIPGNVGMMNPSFDCLLYNTRRDLVRFSYLSSFLPDSKKYIATRKISTRIVEKCVCILMMKPVTL